MSYGGTKTRKVTTYGRKKTQIISIHSDFSPGSTTLPSPLVDSISPIRTKPTRPPLSSKVSIPTTNIPLSQPPRNVKGKQSVPPAVRACSPIVISSDSDSDTDDEIVGQRPRRRGVKAIPRSPSSLVATPSPVKSRAKFNGIELVTRRPIRGSTAALIEGFDSIQIHSEPSSPLAVEDEHCGRLPSRGIIDLLDICSSNTTQPFEDFLSSATFLATTWPSSKSKSSTTIRKIGEASYSEVYGVKMGKEEVVVKVVPLSYPTGPAHNEDGGDMPECSSISDVRREIEITQRMSGLKGGGFVGFLGSFVVEGPYPESLLTEWDHYEEDFGTESIRPDCFTATQQYALIVLSHGGPDLESFRFDTAHSWDQAAGIFWQIADALARAEEWTKFEHRDLHEGQILLLPHSLQLNIPTNYASPLSTGIEATIIDFGLSRLDMENGTPTWTAVHEDVYDGTGEQWDVYRRMRDTVAGDWKGFHGITNVMWLNYLLRYMIHSKGLRKPRITAKPAKTPSTPLRATRRLVGTPAKKKTTASASCGPEIEKAWSVLHQVELVLQTSLKSGSLRRVKKGDIKGDVALSSARNIVDWGRRMGWIA